MKLVNIVVCLVLVFVGALGLQFFGIIHSSQLETVLERIGLGQDSVVTTELPLTTKQAGEGYTRHEIQTDKSIVDGLAGALPSNSATDPLKVTSALAELYRKMWLDKQTFGEIAGGLVWEVPDSVITETGTWATKTIQTTTVITDGVSLSQSNVPAIKWLGDQLNKRWGSRAEVTVTWRVSAFVAGLGKIGYDKAAGKVIIHLPPAGYRPNPEYVEATAEVFNWEGKPLEGRRALGKDLLPPEELNRARDDAIANLRDDKALFEQAEKAAAKAATAFTWQLLDGVLTAAATEKGVAPQALKDQVGFDKIEIVVVFDGK